MRFAVLLFLAMLTGCFAAFAQQDSTARKPVYRSFHVTDTSRNSAAKLLDSVARAMDVRRRYVEDSVTMFFVKRRDTADSQQYVQYLLDQYAYKGYGFLDLHTVSKTFVKSGSSKHLRDVWVIGVVILLLVYTGVLNLVMGKDIQTVFQSFYSKRLSAQVSNEETLLNSWAFVGLFLLFGFTTALFVYQITVTKNMFYSITGFQLFLTLAVSVMALFIFKFMVLKFMGFVFDVRKAVGEYIGILHLTYFNITFVFLPLTVCFSLLSLQFYQLIMMVALISVIVIFVWQYIRSSLNIISNFRFHKFYLIIYLCALEICPVLILIKALNI